MEDNNENELKRLNRDIKQEQVPWKSDLQRIADLIKKSNIGENESENNIEIIEEYNKTLQYRNLLINIFYIEERKKEKTNIELVDDICDFYEGIKKWNSGNENLKQEIWNVFIQETFIYLIAILMKTKRYKTINILITKSYLDFEYPDKVIPMDEYFYIAKNSISEAKKLIDKSETENGDAEQWIENLNENVTKEEFIQADLLIYNLSILLNDNECHWYPKTFMNSNHYLEKFSIQLKSNYEIERMKELFGISQKTELSKLLEKMKISKHYACLERGIYAELITDYINGSDEVGKYN